MKQRTEEAAADQGVLRLSMDAKATVKVGPAGSWWQEPRTHRGSRP